MLLLPPSKQATPCHKQGEGEGRREGKHSFPIYIKTLFLSSPLLPLLSSSSIRCSRLLPSPSFKHSLFLLEVQGLGPHTHHFLTVDRAGQIRPGKLKICWWHIVRWFLRARLFSERGRREKKGRYGGMQGTQKGERVERGKDEILFYLRGDGKNEVGGGGGVGMGAGEDHQRTCPHRYFPYLEVH